MLSGGGLSCCGNRSRERGRGRERESQRGLRVRRNKAIEREVDVDAVERQREDSEQNRQEGNLETKAVDRQTKRLVSCVGGGCRPESDGS